METSVGHHADSQRVLAASTKAAIGAELADASTPIAPVARKYGLRPERLRRLISLGVVRAPPRTHRHGRKPDLSRQTLRAIEARLRDERAGVSETARSFGLTPEKLNDMIRGGLLKVPARKVRGRRPSLTPAALKKLENALADPSTSVGSIAPTFGLAPATIAGMIRAGVLQVDRRGTGRPRRFTPETVAAIERAFAGDPSPTIARVAKAFRLTPASLQGMIYRGVIKAPGRGPR